MDYKIKGKVIEVGETKDVGSNGFTKREVVIDTNANPNWRENPVKVTFKKDDCAKCDALAVGDCVSVEGYVEGRRWEGPNGVKFFIDLTAKSVIVEKKAEGAAVEAAESVYNFQTLLAFAKSRGMADEKEVNAIGAAYGKKLGLKSAQFARKDWVAVAAAVEDAVRAQADKAAKTALEDELPF